MAGGARADDRRRGVEGPATGSDATRRRGVGVGVDVDVSKGGASSISTSSASSSDETEAGTTDPDDALRTGNVRDAAAAGLRGVVVVRGRFEGVSGAKTLSWSSSEAETDASEREKEKATLRFALPLAREGVWLLVARRADLVGDADRDCGCDCEREGVLIGVDFDDAASVVMLAFFLRISLIVVRMDSFNSTHSSSIAFTRREKTLSDTPYLSTSETCCTAESWCACVRAG